MTGQVFHPGHDPLHGVTVLLEAKEHRTYIGRFDTEDQSGVHLIDVAVHDPGSSALPTDEFVRRTLKFGVRVDRKHTVVPRSEILNLKPLNMVSP